MRLHIPRLGEQLTLDKDWTFQVFAETRNISLMQLIEGREIDWRDLYGGYPHYKAAAALSAYPKPYTIPAGTVMAVERIYIRKGGTEFDSLTFRVKSSPDQTLVGQTKKFGIKGARFWAKLDDVNNMEIK